MTPSAVPFVAALFALGVGFTLHGFVHLVRYLTATPAQRHFTPYKQRVRDDFTTAFVQLPAGLTIIGFIAYFVNKL